MDISLLLLAGVLNVRDAGAVGDGVVDDTAAIQAAIDTVAAESRGVVFFPAGTYRVCGTLRHVGNCLALVGVAANRSAIVHDPDVVADAVVFAGAAAGYESDNSVRGLTIQSTNPRSRHLLDVCGQEGFLLDHAYVTGGVHAVRVNDAIHGRMVFSKIRGASSHGLVIGDAGDAVTTYRIVDCYLSSNRGAGCYSVGGSGAHFSGCIFESNGTYGLHVATGSARVVAGHFEGNGAGCVRAGDAWPGAVYTYLQSIGNTFVGKDAEPIFGLDYAVLTSLGDYAVTPAGVFVRPTVHTMRVQVLSDPIPPTATTLIPVSAPDTGATRGFLGSPVFGLVDYGATGIGPYAPNVREGAQHFILRGDFALDAPIGHPVISQAFTVLLTQDEKGGHVVTWDAVFDGTWSDAGNVAGARSNVTFLWNGTRWNQIAYVAWHS